MTRGARFVLSFVLLALLATGAVGVSQHAAVAAGPCTDDSRACVVAASQTYLDALLSQDASKVRFAPEVVRYENGIASGRGADDLRHNVETFPLYEVITAIRNVKWTVEGTKAIAFYLIDAQLAPGVPRHVSTAHVAEKFHVRNGLINRIDVVVCFAGGLRPESGQTDSVAGPLTNLCARNGPRGV